MTPNQKDIRDRICSFDEYLALEYEIICARLKQASLCIRETRDVYSHAAAIARNYAESAANGRWSADGANTAQAAEQMAKDIAEALEKRGAE